MHGTSDEEDDLDRSPPVEIQESDPNGALMADEDLPVVARMVVEIRSDGRRTVARGALEDAQRNERVAIRAEGTTPLALAGSLTRALSKAPFLAQALSDAPFLAGRAAGRAIRRVRGLLAGDTEDG